MTAKAEAQALDPPAVMPPPSVLSPREAQMKIRRFSGRPIKKFGHSVSPLDPADHRSGVHTSEFRGLYNLAMICGALYSLNTAVSNMLSDGVLSDPKLLLAVFYSHHFIEVIVTIGVQVLYSYTALIPVYMASTQWFSGRLLVNTMHHFLQSVLFVFTVVFIIYRDWNTIHATSAFVECLVLVMKMHSYIRTKLELARESDSKPEIDIVNYTVYLLHPTLVYEPKYPRTTHIRWGYVAEKFVANALAMSTLYLIVTDYMLPRLEDSGIENPVLVVMSLLLPFLGSYLLIWFIIFECILNGFAELTYLADRDFYGDWWNCTTFDEFARKWNKPVHEFLLRHVYLESLETYKLTRRSATMLTFFVSALLHECVFAIIFRTVKMYFFCLQMLQVVIILYGRGLKGTRLGNYTFWFGVILGPPLQAVLYCREYHGGEPIFMNVMVPTMFAGFGGVLIGSLMCMKPHKRVPTQD